MSGHSWDDGWWEREAHRGPFVGLRARVLGSLAASVAWVCLTLLYVAFWAHGFSWYQSVVVVIVSIVLLFGVLAGLWISYGLRAFGGWHH